MYIYDNGVRIRIHAMKINLLCIEYATGNAAIMQCYKFVQNLLVKKHNPNIVISNCSPTVEIRES